MPSDDMPISEGFTLKEWLAAISAKLDRLEQKLDNKAEATFVNALEQRLTVVEKAAAESTIIRSQLMVPQLERLAKDVEELRDMSARVDAVDAYRKWIYGMAAVIAANIVANVMQLVFH